ncbi:MAG: pyridoxal phosphate-dependent aminotransferase, partial [Novosphingobium sp.]
MTNAPAPKPWINAIHAYVPGKASGADGRPLVKLSANENPLGTSAAALAARAAAQVPSLYPDPGSSDLRAALGALHGIDPARIVLGTGSDELLNLAAQGYAGQGDEVLFSRFSFAVYDIAARRCGAAPVEAPDKDYGSDVDALLAAVTERTRVLFLANPNNPTGTYLPASEVARLHAGLPADVLFVLDQAYAEYLTPEQDDHGLALAAAHQNVLVTRTFSKIYGLAAVADQAFVTASREHNRAERARFVTAVEARGNPGLRVVPREANFRRVLFDGALSAETAYNGLAERGYI